MQRKIVPNVVARKQVATVVVEDTAFQAAKLMADNILQHWLWLMEKVKSSVS